MIAITNAAARPAASSAGTLAPTRMPASQNPCALSYTEEVLCTP